MNIYPHDEASLVATKMANVPSHIGLSTFASSFHGTPRAQVDR